jgi:GT2 family glycosyltransferase
MRDCLDISVVMACYTQDRIDSIEAALNSLRSQTLQPRRVIVAVDNNEALANYLSCQFDWVTVVLHRGARGAAATRNRGVEIVETTYTAFLDDDEAAQPDWLHELVQPFDRPEVIGTGGKYEPKWLVGKPSWFPDEFAWTVGGAYVGLPTTTSEVRNVWSGNMAVRTSLFRGVGGFDTDLSKRDATPRPEDTDLCIRMAAATGGQWMYVPSAVINHDIPPARASLRFFVSRCFSEGRGKALLRNSLEASSFLETERDYARRVVRAVLSRVGSLRPAPGLQALVMLLGLSCAGCGYVLGRVGGRGPRDTCPGEAGLT